MKSQVNSYIVGLLVLVGALLGSACSTRKVIPTLTINYTVSTQVNPDMDNVPSPVVVNIYELKNITTFRSVDYFTLNDNPKRVLGDDLVEQSQIELRPDQQMGVTKNLNPETLYVAVTAAYRLIDRVKWRDFMSLTSNASVVLSVKLAKEGVAIGLQ